MELPAIVTLLALLEYMFFAFRVGTSRAKYGVAAPATSGNPEWDRLFRVQQNTLEQLIIFVPALWVSRRSSARRSALQSALSSWSAGPSTTPAM